MNPVWSTLEGRIRWLIDARGVDQRTFSAGAVLPSGARLSSGYVGSYLARVAKDPNATMNADALAALARRWNASPAWLLLGDGAPDDTTPTAPTFADAPSWPAARRAVLAKDPSLAWALDVVATWPAPPAAVPVSVGLVAEHAATIARYYPPPTDSRTELLRGLSETLPAGFTRDRGGTVHDRATGDALTPAEAPAASHGNAPGRATGS